jgi:solute carrier family 25 carnitine/acylcarnitine transporter 20/29
MDDDAPFLVDLIAGWCSGATAVILCQPIDTILTRKQAGRSLIVGSETAKGLVLQAGLWSLWCGASPMIGAVSFQNALLMAGYGAGKRYGGGDNDNNSNKMSIFVGGCTGRVVQSF